MSQKILLNNQREQLRKNAFETTAAQMRGDEEPDHFPVVKFFNPCGAATWLITEIDDDNIMYGLCDLGMGFTELGDVSLDELTSMRLQFGLKIERDAHFTAQYPISEYARKGRELGRIAA